MLFWILLLLIGFSSSIVDGETEADPIAINPEIILKLRLIDAFIGTSGMEIDEAISAMEVYKTFIVMENARRKEDSGVGEDHVNEPSSEDEIRDESQEEIPVNEDSQTEGDHAQKEIDPLLLLQQKAQQKDIEFQNLRERCIVIETNRIREQLIQQHMFRKIFNFSTAVEDFLTELNNSLISNYSGVFKKFSQRVSSIYPEQVSLLFPSKNDSIEAGAPEERRICNDTDDETCDSADPLESKKEVHSEAYTGFVETGYSIIGFLGVVVLSNLIVFILTLCGGCCSSFMFVFFVEGFGFWDSMKIVSSQCMGYYGGVALLYWVLFSISWIFWIFGKGKSLFSLIFSDFFDLIIENLKFLFRLGNDLEEVHFFPEWMSWIWYNIITVFFATYIPSAITSIYDFYYKNISLLEEGENMATVDLFLFGASSISASEWWYPLICIISTTIFTVFVFWTCQNVVQRRFLCRFFLISIMCFFCTGLVLAIFSFSYGNLVHLFGKVLGHSNLDFDFKRKKINYHITYIVPLVSSFVSVLVCYYFTNKYYGTTEEEDESEDEESDEESEGETETEEEEEEEEEEESEGEEEDDDDDDDDESEGEGEDEWEEEEEGEDEWDIEEEEEGEDEWEEEYESEWDPDEANREEELRRYNDRKILLYTAISSLISSILAFVVLFIVFQLLEISGIMKLEYENEIENPLLMPFKFILWRILPSILEYIAIVKDYCNV